MSKQLEWTKATLEDVRNALDTSMGKVTRDSLIPTKVLENWDKVQSWLTEVTNIAGVKDRTVQVQGVPPFPLSGEELRALQISVDRIAHAQAAASPYRAGITPATLFESLMRLRASSYFLLGAITCSLIASIVNFILFQNTYERFFVGVSVGLSLTGILVWTWHFAHLSHHKTLLYAVHPRTSFQVEPEHGRFKDNSG
jgi:hypothetical protein